MHTCDGQGAPDASSHHLRESRDSFIRGLLSLPGVLLAGVSRFQLLHHHRCQHVQRLKQSWQASVMPPCRRAVCE